MKSKYFKKRKGATLVYVIILLVISSLIFTEVIKIILSQIEYGESREAREQALVLAEAGMDFYRWYLTHKVVEYPSPKLFREFWESGNPYGVDVPYEREYMGVGRYSISVTPPDEGITEVLVESTGWRNDSPNHQRTVNAILKRPSWGDYVSLANVTDGHMRFGSGTEVYGILHSNGGIRFDGLAHSIVSSSLYSYDDPDHDDPGDPDPYEFGVHTHIPPIDPNNPSPPDIPPTRLDVFEAGRRLEVMEVDFGKVLRDLGNMKEIAGCDYDNCENNDYLDRRAEGYEGIYFNRNRRGRHIILNDPSDPEDTFRIRTVRRVQGSSNQITQYSGGWQTFDIPQDGVIFVEENVWVEGQVDDNRVTIVAADLVIAGGEKNIYIGYDDILYTSYDGADSIALIAQEDIDTIKWSKNVLRIDAALLAYNGRVGRSYYSGVQRDIITIFGSIVTNHRYGFAYTDGTGYQIRNLIYDENLSSIPPPYFPSEDKYVVSSWREI